MYQSLYETVYKLITAHDLIPHGARVVVGVSGGADSVFLLHALKYAQERGACFTVISAHFNHGIRGKAADDDERFVKELCESLGVECVTSRADVPAFARDNGYTEEQAGRLLRYKFFESLSPDRIAVAHHMDDQAESVLMHIIRGSGLRGLCGMSPITGKIIRPLLYIRRSEIEAALSEQNIPYCTDATNFEPNAVRNRIRLNVIPYISREINPGFTKNLCSMSRRLSEDEAYLWDLAEKELAGLKTDVSGNGVGYLRQGILELPPPIRYRAISSALQSVGATADIEERHIDLLVEFLSAGTGKELDLPHSRVRIEYDSIVFMPYGETVGTGKERVPFPTDKPTEFMGYEFSPDTVTGCVYEREEFTAYMDADKLPEHLELRTRLPGDRFFPLGIQGSKKLKDYFIDRKTPRPLREVPLIADADTGEILYVTGHTVSERVRVTDRTERMLRVRVTKKN